MAAYESREGRAMRILATIFLTFSLGAALLAQTPVSTQLSPDVDVLSYRWGVPHYITFDQIPDPPILKRKPENEERKYPRPPGKRRDKQTVTKFKTYAQVKNTGDKRIKAISWCYIFYADQDYQQEVMRYNFRSKTGILPGEEKDLIKQVVDRAPTDHQRVLIDHIEYSDGSKWQRSGSK
jgi:hypothetical protein